MISVLYYLGVMQFIVRNIGQALAFLLGTSPAESLNAAGNIFVGMVRLNNNIFHILYKNLFAATVLLFNTVYKVIFVPCNLRPSTLAMGRKLNESEYFSERSSNKLVCNTQYMQQNASIIKE